MASSPARARVVRKVTDERIAQRINDERNHQGKTYKVSTNPHDLTVKDEKEVVEAITFYTKRHGAKAIGHLSSQTDLAVIAHCDSSGFVIFGAFDQRLLARGRLKKV